MKETVCRPSFLFPPAIRPDGYNRIASMRRTNVMNVFKPSVRDFLHCPAVIDRLFSFRVALDGPQVQNTSV